MSAPVRSNQLEKTTISNTQLIKYLSLPEVGQALSPGHSQQRQARERITG
jgi:hypothetical protein